MSGIDVFIVIVFAYNIVVGLSNGFLKSLFGVGAFVLATFLSPFFQGFTTRFIEGYLQGQQELAKIFGLGLTWFIIYIVLNFMATVIIKGMNKTPLKTFDRIAGLLVGIFMSFVIVVLPLLVISAIPILKDVPQIKEPVSKSVLLPLFSPLGAPFERLVRNALREQREELMKNLRVKQELLNPTPKKATKNKGKTKQQEMREVSKSIDGLGKSRSLGELGK